MNGTTKEITTAELRPGLDVPLDQVQVDPEHGHPVHLACRRARGILTASIEKALK